MKTLIDQRRLRRIEIGYRASPLFGGRQAFSPGHLEGNDEEAPERVMPQSPGGCGDDGAE